MMRAQDDAAEGRAQEGDLRGTRTHDNLKKYFALDSQARLISARFAQIAQHEGFPSVARMFEEMDELLNVVTQGHLDFLIAAGDPLSGKSLGETARNLRAAYLAQLGEVETLRESAGEARNEGFPDIASWFETLASLRLAHGKKCEDLIHSTDDSE
jgi:rubrerythrin